MQFKDEGLSDFRVQLKTFNLVGFGVPLSALVVIASYLLWTGTVVDHRDVRQLVGPLWLGAMVALGGFFVRAYRLRPSRSESYLSLVGSSSKSNQSQENLTSTGLAHPLALCAPLVLIPALVILPLWAADRFYYLGYTRGDWRMILLLTWGTALLVVLTKFARSRRQRNASAGAVQL